MTWLRYEMIWVRNDWKPMYQQQSPFHIQSDASSDATIPLTQNVYIYIRFCSHCCVSRVKKHRKLYLKNLIFASRRLSHCSSYRSLCETSLAIQVPAHSDHITFEPPHHKTNKMAYAPSEDSDQPGHPPSLIRVFTVRMKKALVLSYPLSAQRRL